MIILDTNVLSELLRSDADAGVVAWLDRQDTDELFTTAMSVAELLQGVAIMPHGARRSELGLRVARLLTHGFTDRVLPFDSEAAVQFADVVATRRRHGRPVTVFDAQIAAVARTRSAAVATRNARDFELAGVEIVNPWNRFGVSGQ
ncbi:MAG: type II toxin-antitoxin system VapC family toxin [Herbiconiux sp.]|nr:type II toxin-antitoxin system VapC family toxin [Herbiconiux sp.]